MSPGAGTAATSRRRQRGRFEAHRNERREQLLDAATEVVRRLGADATMEAIAAEVGVAKPVLYRYFGDRTGLFDALAARFSALLVATLDRALARDLPPRELVVATIDAYVGVLEDDPQVYRFATSRMRSASATRAGALDAATTMLAGALGEVAGGRPRPAGQAEVWAAGVVGMVHAAADRWVERRSVTRAALVAHLADLVWSGIAGEPQHPPEPAEPGRSRRARRTRR